MDLDLILILVLILIWILGLTLLSIRENGLVHYRSTVACVDRWDRRHVRNRGDSHAVMYEVLFVCAEKVMTHYQWSC